MKFMSEYSETWRYITLCSKIWSWQVVGSDVTACTQSAFTNEF